MVIPREVVSQLCGIDPVETTRHLLKIMTKAYILGALHDGTIRKKTFRITQKSKEYVEMLAKAIHLLGGNAWTYREGATRKLYVVEFSKSFLHDATIISKRDKIEYLQGYFDTDGAVSQSSSVRFYLYFCQKSYQDLYQAHCFLLELGIQTGKIHNPSRMVDPNYWRFYISSRSHKQFIEIIGSKHPDKSKYLRMKI
jgi:hypothetical protein